jgi:hypothetical protein
VPGENNCWLQLTTRCGPLSRHPPVPLRSSFCSAGAVLCQQHPHAHLSWPNETQDHVWKSACLLDSVHCPRRVFGRKLLGDYSDSSVDTGAVVALASQQSAYYASWLGYTLSLGDGYTSSSLGADVSNTLLRKRTIGSASAQILGGLFMHQVSGGGMVKK